MALCGDLLVTLFAFLAMFVIPAAALFGGLAWLGTRGKRWAWAAVAILATAAGLIAARLAAGDLDAVWIPMAFIPLAVTSVAAWARVGPWVGAAVLGAAALPPLAMLVYILGEIQATPGCSAL